MKTYHNLVKVELVSNTPDALDLLLRTKNTRLKNSDDVAVWSDERKADELEYMLNTIKSSWEFVDYTFLISGVTRAFTHQLVRTRNASYAQQSQRTVEVSDQPISTPVTVADSRPGNFNDVIWIEATNKAMEAYGMMVSNGTPVQDARGILPTNMTTEIFAKMSLRTLHQMALVRLCTRTQGEYQHVFRLMRDEVLRVHPWAEPFIQVNCVATGCCAFPKYGKVSCKFYDWRMDHSAVIEDTKKKFWDEDPQEANPIAVNGKAQ